MSDTYAIGQDIAVVIVCFNMLEPLKRTLQSVADVRDPRLRVYVVDGASSDGTAAYLRTLDPGSVTWISEPDTGIYDAMNKGWNMVPGTSYVLYMGAGDTLTTPPSPIAAIGNVSDPPKIIFGTCTIGTEPYLSHWDDRLYLSNTAHHQALLIHKSLWQTSPFDASLRVYGDWDFNLRLFKTGIGAVFDPEFRTFAEPGGVSATHNLPEIARIAYRHGGLKLALRAYVRNLRAERTMRTRRRAAGHAAV